MIKRSLQPLLFACLAISAYAAADNPFVGDWKLNPSESTLTDKMTVENLGGNKYGFNFGGGPEPIVVDGTDQPSQLYRGDTLSVAVEGDTWKIIRKRNGRLMISASWSLSQDSNALTDHFTGFNADGSPYQLNYVYKRTAGGSGFAGTWVSTSLEAKNYVVRIQIQPYEESGLSILDAASQFTGNMNFAASLVNRLDDHTLELTRKKNDGELSVFLQLKLSPDLKRLTITPRSATRSEPHILVFDRQ